MPPKWSGASASRRRHCCCASRDRPDVRRHRHRGCRQGHLGANPAPPVEGPDRARIRRGCKVGQSVRVRLLSTDVDARLHRFCLREIAHDTRSSRIPCSSPTRTRDFLASDEARPLRILAEYLEPLQRFQPGGIHDTIVFFGSARLTADGPMGRYYHDAQSSGAPDHAVVEVAADRMHTATSSAPAAAAASWRRRTAAPRRPAARPSDSTSACRMSSSREPLHHP